MFFLDFRTISLEGLEIWPCFCKTTQKCGLVNRFSGLYLTVKIRILEQVRGNFMFHVNSVISLIICLLSFTSES